MIRTLHRANATVSGVRTAANVFAANVLMSMMLVSIPASASDGHERPQLSEAEEAELLASMVANSPHRIALQHAKTTFGDLPANDSKAPDKAVNWTMAPGAGKAWPKKKGPRNYGFLPYWTLKGTNLHWDELTEVAWFSAEVNSAGNITTTHGWGGATAKALIKEAHAHNVQVTLTFTLFSSSGIATVLSTASKRTALVNKITSLVISGGGDGCNIDFEGLPKSAKETMKAFTKELTASMHAKLPGSDVTLATPPVDWSGAWDYDYLAEHSDGLFVMAYGVHYTGSNPGPQMPMASDAPWNHKTLKWVIDDYIKWGKAANKHKFLIGLPLYGNGWASSSSLPGAKKLKKGAAKTYEQAVNEAPGKGGWKWDNGSKSTYYTYKIAGGWQQVWVNNVQAFKLRPAYLKQRGVNMGLWALGYADKSTAMWQEMSKFIGSGSSSGSSSGGGTDAGGSDSGGADAGGSDGGAKDTDSADTNGKDTNAKDTNAKDTNAKDTNAKDTNAKDTGSDTVFGDTGATDSGNQSDAGGKLDTKNSDTANQPNADSQAQTDDDADNANQADTEIGGEPDVAPAQDTGGANADGSTDVGLTVVTHGEQGGSGGCQAVVPAGGLLPFAIMLLMSLAAVVLRRDD
jgi:spore germination protein YaaH